MEYHLGQKIGVTGTPSIILANGQIIGGYLSADALAKGLGLL
jgi:thiol:disulfide interchange protein DsbC